MADRHLYVVRHGAADPYGELTEVGERQSRLLGDRLAALPVGAVWHSPLPRAKRSAWLVGERLSGVRVREAAELDDHVPHVPAEIPAPWARFFAGLDPSEIANGARLAAALLDRFARPAVAETHEVVVTHAFQVAWLVRHALEAPPARWLGLNAGNAALTAIRYRTGAPPAVLVFNDMGHLPPDLRWTGFGPGVWP
jgi:serine/threonine-protein phosphatase PGAM5